MKDSGININFFSLSSQRAQGHWHVYTAQVNSEAPRGRELSGKENTKAKVRVFKAMRSANKQCKWRTKRIQTLYEIPNNKRQNYSEISTQMTTTTLNHLQAFKYLNTNAVGAGTERSKYRE